MTEAWKQWEGQSVEGKFPLRQYLGGSEHSAVFLTELSEREPQKAAIKLVAADPASAELQLANWKLAAQLSHPNLLRIFSSGRCKLEGNDLLYVVMEYAEEDLSQILPQRALTPEETREMLKPVLDALEYLHGKELVHGHLKPSNILANGDQLKISSDGLMPQAKKAAAASRKTSVYESPEAARGEWTSGGDVWSLGATLVEILTQHLPDQPPGVKDPLVPATLPAPFLEIARGCLQSEPRRRHTVADISALLNPSAVRARSAAATASNIDPLSVPLSTVPPRPGSSLPPPARPVAKLQPAPERQQPAASPRPASRFTVPLVVGALVIVGIFIVPRLLPHRSEEQQSPSVATTTAEKPPVQPVAQPAPAPESTAPSKAKPLQEQKPIRTETPSSTQASVPQPAKLQAEESVKATSEKEKAPAIEDSTAAPAASSPPAKSSPVGLTHTKGEVLDQILPDVSDKARATIQGKVRVTVRVHVDPSGSVSGADLDSPGPSKYFADLALQAARRWAFTSPEVDGHSVPSEWLLRFEFSQKDTKVAPSQVSP